MSHSTLGAKSDFILQETKVLPVMPLRNTVVFPHQILPLIVGRERSLQLLEEAAAANEQIALVTQKEGATEDPAPDDLFRFGTMANILRIFKVPDGSQHVVVQGTSRFAIIEFVEKEPYFRARVSIIPENGLGDNVRIEALIRNLKSLVQKALELAPYLPQDIGLFIMNTDHPDRLADLVSSFMNIPTAEKQQLLETVDTQKRLEQVTKLLTKEIEVLELGKKIQQDVTGEMEKSQKDYYLREQLKAIQRELGEDDDQTVELRELEKKIAKVKMPKHVRKVAAEELKRLGRMSPAAADYTVTRTYLDWLIDIPWSNSTKDNHNIKAASGILEDDHYGLEKVKQRILEYLSVRKLKPDLKGPILCFTGPPGVGKTSLGKSIARALGREFVRISLGGMRDEAEIRGHRRTYIGAMPGRIIQGLKRAGVNNPVFMLDEIDKVGNDFRGDPSSALLEVLDPEQNNAFSDHYVDVDVDLSKVMFIATSNLVDPIPPALRDRMEILSLPGYTSLEKRHIAKKYLVPKQIVENGLKGSGINFSDSALDTLINSYTKEAGVRNLEREIANMCRGIARDKAENKKLKKSITARDVEKRLGPPRFELDIKERTSRCGVATGLAWTSVGGDILFIEATSMPGKGVLTLTGNLGQVMKESAQAALSYTRANVKKLGISSLDFSKLDLHVHVPSGAIPKDGPSAGVTMFSALVSLLSNRPVRHDVAMTGEISLRGTVLPIGGLKEKVLAAKQAGIFEVLVPERNRKDLEEIPKDIKDGVTFHFVSEMSEVLQIALAPAARRKSTRKAPNKKPATKKIASRKVSRKQAGRQQEPLRR